MLKHIRTKEAVSNGMLNSEINTYWKQLKQLKAEYRLITGFDSDSNWVKFKRILEELGVLSPQLTESQNRANLVFYSRIRKELPRTGVNLKASLQIYLREKQFVEALNGRRLTGQEIVDYLLQQGVQVNPSTLTFWFRNVGGFRRKAQYLPEDILKILYRAALYKVTTRSKQQTQD